MAFSTPFNAYTLWTLACLLSSSMVSSAELAVTFGESVFGNLQAGSWDYLRLDASGCNGYIHVELWNIETFNSSNSTGSDKADPMLMMRPDVRPFAAYDSSGTWAWSPNTANDEFGYRLLRAYHHVIVNQSNYCTLCGGLQLCQVRSCQQGIPPSIFHIGIYNVDIFMAHPLKYEVRATCEPEELPCPAPTKSKLPCNGVGTCKAGKCHCDPGHGDVGCDKQLQVMDYGVPLSQSIEVGRWAYYELTVDTYLPSLLVELRRTAGDPVLFLKHISHGYVSGGVPSVSDYTQFADTEGFRSRLNYHHRILRDVAPGKYYVAVFNNDVYLQEEAHYSVQALSTPNALGGLCPMNCSYPNGVCIPSYLSHNGGVLSHVSNDGGGVAIAATVDGFNDECTCAEGFAGHMCEGKLEQLVLDQVYKGQLAPADWIYFVLELPPSEKGFDFVDSGLKLSLKKAGGYPVLLSKKTDIPMLLDNDFIFPTGHELDAESQFLVESKDLSPGLYYMGIFNMDYYTHSACSFELRVSLSEVDIVMFNPTMSIVLGVLSSMFLCLFMSVCKRMFYRTTRGRFGPNGLGGAGVMVDALANGVTSNERGRAVRGLTLEQIAAFPTVQYQEGMFEKEDAQCSVCLGDYEPNEQLRKLPACEHSFHITCIDRWLVNNTTCPLCRMELDPQGAAERQREAEEAAQEEEIAALEEQLEAALEAENPPAAGGPPATPPPPPRGSPPYSSPRGAGESSASSSAGPGVGDTADWGSPSSGAQGAYVSLTSWMGRNPLVRNGAAAADTSAPGESGAEWGAREGEGEGSLAMEMSSGGVGVGQRFTTAPVMSSPSSSREGSRPPSSHGSRGSDQSAGIHAPAVAQGLQALTPLPTVADDTVVTSATPSP